MERKTYYTVLGVSSTETARGIRAAYRDLAKRLHPDVAGDDATRAFQEVTEAYDVLSDPRRRRDYNDLLQRSADGDVVATVRRRPEPSVRDPVAILGSLEGLDFEVLLTQEEAIRGCVVPIGVPVFSRCPRCRGSGRVSLFPCALCQQQGMIENEKLLRVRIAPMAPPGSVYEIPLRGVGVHNFYLRLRVFVEARPA